MIVFNPIIDIGYVVLIGVVVLILTVLTYWKVSTRLTTGRKIFLLSSRIIATVLLLIILLQPSRQHKDELKRDELKLGVLIDSSKSMNQNDVDGGKRIDYASSLALEEIKAGGIPIEFSAFDEKTRPLSKEQLEEIQASGNTTRIHDSVKDLFSRQNSYGMKAVILLTDGHDMQDEDPSITARTASAHHCKIFALPIGSKGKVRDLHVSLSASQDYIFKGNKIGLTAHIRARSCQFEQITLELLKNGKIIDTRQLNLEDKPEHSLQFSSLEDTKAITEYIVRVTKLDAEVDHKNNVSTVFVNCIDKQIKTLLLEGQPHWDTTFLRRFLQKNKMVTVDSFTQFRQGSVSSTTAIQGTELPKTLEQFKKYDLILLGRQVDQLLTEDSVNSLKKYAGGGGAVIFTRGNAFQSDSGRSIQPVEWDEEGYDEVVLKSTSDGRRLSLFRKLDDIAEQNGSGFIPSLPLSRKIALKKPLSQFLAVAEDNNNDNTQALVYRRFGKGQVMSFGVEGIWQWKFNKNYSKDNDYYASFWDQSILWLIHNSEFLPGSLFSFRQDVSSVELGDRINFTFSVRNKEDIPAADPEIVIKSAEGQVYRLNMKKDPHAAHRFRSSFTAPAEGMYTVETVDPSGKKHLLKFISSHNSLEEKEVNVDVEYLRELCSKTGGRILKVEELGEMNKLVSNETEQGTHERIKMKAVWDKTWLMYLICLFFGLDWYYRRKWGLC